MIATRFRSVGWVAAVATAALGCYLVSLRVASERNKVEALDSAILDTRRNIQDLRIEIATRGGLNQIEKWNISVLSLTAPKAGQFLKGEMQLASLNMSPADTVQDRVGEPKDQTPVGTKVIPVSYPAPAPAPASASPDQPILRSATYIRPAGDRVVDHVQKVALLDDGLLGELRHTAAGEKAGTRKAQQ
ncbi:hypothetical protein [Flavisphingomonas formosensis]|uniref:hypothetical protein n=1 Tax=Flavisphingomonas formosensis TaxID=861534 RepID=UPI0012F88D15|nr:hypothetical protein [Sphingomonas formosensis]